MSRLASQEKLLYYPTPEPIVEAIARYLSVRSFTTVRLLDPCAGKGEALARLTERLHEGTISQLPAYARSLQRSPVTLETYGIEPERQRAKAAFACLDHVLHASFFSTTLSGGDDPDGGWQCIFLNPPYDRDSESGQAGRKSRLEVTFLQRATLKLCCGGILVWIVPQPLLRPAAALLAGQYERLTCLRFPDDVWRPDARKSATVSLYGQFQQVVLFAVKRLYAITPHQSTVEMIEAWATAGLELPVLPLESRLEAVPTYTIPNARSATLSRFVSGSYAPDETARLVAQRSSKTGRYKTGVWANADYVAARFPDERAVGFGIGTPMAPLKHAHLAVLSVAGIANRAVLEGKDGRRVIIKGYSRKVPIYSKYEDEEEIVEKLVDTFETALWCIDLDTGGLIRIETGTTTPPAFSVPFESMALPAFLENFSLSLTQQVAQANPPRYQNPGELPWVAEGLAQLKRQPLGKQREVILANVHAFLCGQPLQRVAPVAEMATGKTYMALCSAYLADRYACGGANGAYASLPGTRLSHLFPLIVLCPPIMARKWQREAEQTLPNARVIIVKRVGTAASADRKPLQNEEEGTEPTRDDLGDFLRFDPTFSGSALSAVGCMDRVVARIRAELASWQRDCQAAQAQGQPLPLKPCHIVILTTSTAKLGKEWMPVYRLKVARYIDPETKRVKLRRDATGAPYTIPCCPRCFRALKDERRMAQLAKASKEYRQDVAQAEQHSTRRWMAAFEQEALEWPQTYLSERELLGNREHRVKRRCSECGEPLWQYIAGAQDFAWHPSSVLEVEHTTTPLPLPTRERRPAVITYTARRRYPLGDYVQQRYRGCFHLLIADEVHEGSDGTALDFARQRLASACGRMMGLTGTLSNGYSASLFRLYYVLNPAVRRDFGYDDVERWIDLYGKRQVTRKTYKEKELGNGSMSDRRIGKPITKEIAGFAPQGLSRVLPCSTFLELVDVAPGLPPYREEIRDVDMDGVLFPAYDAFEREATREIGRMLARGDKSGLSTWWNGLLTYPNMPYRGWTCIIKKTQEIFATAPKLPEERIYPKERAIIDYVQQEYDAGRRVLIYSENTGYYDIMPRLKRLLEVKVCGRHNQPLRVAILRSTTVETINREAWLDSQVAAGCDVLICNPKLVKVGLDLIAFPTILYASLPKSTSDLRQSSRRSLRPGQTKPVNVVFFVYPGMELRLLELMARKMEASLMVEGKLPGEGLVSFGGEEAEDENDMYVQLAREVLASLEAESGVVSAKERAQALQALFQENVQLEREQNQVLGQESPVEAVVFDPIRIEPLATSDSFAPEETIMEVQVASPAGIVESVSMDAPEQGHVQVDASHATEGVMVTIIHTAVTSGKDIWADLRSKYLVPKKRRKQAAAYPETAISLWETSATSPTAPDRS